MIIALAAGLALGGLAPQQGPRPAAPQAGTCQPCHQQIVASFRRTVHFHTSAEATPATVLGRFSAGHDVLRTSSPGVYFVMERRPGGFYQSSVDSARADRRTARIDLVVGSGRRGQTYLYWSNEQLFELPVSYLTGAGAWINSPGYVDGQIDFARPIIPRCLECHSTSFTLVNDRGTPRYLDQYVLGISCEKCHGDGRAHVAYQAAHPGDSTGRYIANPARLSRDRQVDNCALCHSGDRGRRRPAFSYRVGEPLDDYLLPASQDSVPDVHGNQVGLLERSKCFRASPTMTCSTCHDVHQVQRDLAALAEKCLGCHQTSQHPLADRIGGRMVADCIDCHMPTRKSRAIDIQTPTRRIGLQFRSHAIGIYPAVAEALLRSRTGP